MKHNSLNLPKMGFKSLKFWWPKVNLSKILLRVGTNFKLFKTNSDHHDLIFWNGDFFFLVFLRNKTTFLSDFNKNDF